MLIQRIVKAFIDVGFGVVAGGVLLLIILLIPDLIGNMKSVTPYVKGTAGRLVIGIIGGIVGAPGLSSAVLKKVFN